MRVLFTAVGEPKAPWAKSALDHYARFLNKYARCDWRWVKAVSPHGKKPMEIRRLEGERLLAAVGKAAGFRIACDPTGKQFDSEAFAALWQRETDQRGGRAVLIVGGAWGLSPAVNQWADLVWSFGVQTYPHELALTVAVEQVARALSILRGDSYHK
ncbi:MAG: 23S rRNA (pseudouridine(1915)-N(3))-methyltransferase RlmH [Acidobacteria bacterium]|nr:23S rRNA (pseudouridine(1915)-N(3))-methyltransferase RlmH [Acidobacteriota bacterium]